MCLPVPSSPLVPSRRAERSSPCAKRPPNGFLTRLTKEKKSMLRYNHQKIKGSVLLEKDQLFSAAPVSMPSIIILAAILCLPASIVLAQAASADYTNDLPSVERVKAEIKGSDATDTLARQVAIFTYLPAYIARINYNRPVRGDF